MLPAGRKGVTHGSEQYKSRTLHPVRQDLHRTGAGNMSVIAAESKVAGRVQNIITARSLPTEANLRAGKDRWKAYAEVYDSV